MKKTVDGDKNFLYLISTMKIDSEQVYNRLRLMRLDKFEVDQGLMLNCLVGALTGMVVWQDKNGKVDVNDIVDAIERTHKKCKLVKN